MEQYTYASVLSASAFVGLLPLVDTREEEVSAEKPQKEKPAEPKKIRVGFWSLFRHAEN